MKPRFKRAHIATLLGLSLVFGISNTGWAGEATQQSRSAAGYLEKLPGDGRRNPETLTDFRLPPGVTPKKQRSQSALLQDGIQCCDYWIYAADTELFDDFDGDGYYTYLRVYFDIDTYFSAADVYVNLYLARPDEPWSLYYESEVFTVFGTSGSDDYEIETELVSGYLPGDYDVLIEVYDAVYDELVISYGPAESAALSFLQLEDVSYDVIGPTQVTISGGHGCGGALSYFTVLWLMMACWARMRRFPPDDREQK